MILSALKVLELGLIENLCERESENPEGVGLDLRVGSAYQLIGDGYLGITDRRFPKDELIGQYDPKKSKIITMKPGDYILVRTIESVKIPKEKTIIEEGLPPRYVMPHVYPRKSLQTYGISFYATKTDPGYSGPLVFGIKNNRNENFSFELGARMFNIVFHQVTGEINRPYSGQHQGGRVTSGGSSEVQN